MGKKAPLIEEVSDDEFDFDENDFDNDNSQIGS
jgi:hypothetical protein